MADPKVWVKRKSCTTFQIPSPVFENTRLLNGEAFIKLNKSLFSKAKDTTSIGDVRILKISLYPPTLFIESKKKNQFKSIEFELIDELRLGCDASKKVGCFTIVYKYKGKFKHLQLQAKTNEICLEWVGALNFLLSRKDEDFVLYEEFLKNLWGTVDITNKGSLDLHDIAVLLKKLGYPFSRTDLVSFFKVSPTHVKNMTLSQFTEMYRKLKFRPEVSKLFSKVCKDGIGITFDEFKVFIKKVQKERHSDQAVLETFERFCGDGNNSMDIERFTGYLLSQQNSFLDTRLIGKVTQCMDQPLQNYFINTSHNTYLLGDQLISSSSVEGYIRALVRGCKCVEIDCWDGVNNQPMIYHGRTLTSKIPFKDVIEVIKKYAFVVSDYPLILSLENHCSEIQQSEMKRILVDVLGDFLLHAPIDGLNGVLPSPNMLKNKILIKGKVFGESGDRSSLKRSVVSPLSKSPIPSPKQHQIPTKQSQSLPITKTKKVLISDELASLVFYLKGKSSKKLETLPGDLEFDQLYSLTDRKANLFLQKQGSEMRDMVKEHFLRIYPSFIRVTSSNFNPLPYWDLGVQMVALNFQTKGLAMDLNDALFELNGSSGYVLKPKTKYQVCIKIRVISAQQIYKDNMAPISCFVQVDLVTPTTNISMKTRSNESKTFNPLFEEEFEFVVFHNKLAFLSFKLISNDDLTEIGWFRANIDCIQEGYRHIPLNDVNGERMSFSSIFVYIDEMNKNPLATAESPD